MKSLLITWLAIWDALYPLVFHGDSRCKVKLFFDWLPGVTAWDSIGQEAARMLFSEWKFTPIVCKLKAASENWNVLRHMTLVNSSEF